MMDVVRWFQPASDETPNTNEWHAYYESGAESACGETRINYNIDQIADSVPDGGRAHAGCREALDGKNPEAKYVPWPGDAVEPEAEAVSTDAVTEPEATTTEESQTTEGQIDASAEITEPVAETQVVEGSDVGSGADVLGAPPAETDAGSGPDESQP